MLLPFCLHVLNIACVEFFSCEPFLHSMVLQCCVLSGCGWGCKLAHSISYVGSLFSGDPACLYVPPDLPFPRVHSGTTNQIQIASKCM